MVTKVTIRNFKKLESISFSLSQSVVIIGPNNSGKSTIFQALCLWEIGVKNFIAAKQQGKLNKNGAVTLNRKDLVNSPIGDARFLWTNRKTTYQDNKKGQKHIVLSVELEGEDNGTKWKSSTEFYYYNTESFSCKILSGITEMIHLYNNNRGIHFGFLQPMSGISTSEDKLTLGSIDRKLGEGKTAEVLRNICYEILYPETIISKVQNPESDWKRLCDIMKSMFGVQLQKPEFIKSTGLISLEYIENTKIKYDISSGGRGFQQTLLLLAYMFANPNTILLLDEPDAHLEVIRQREAFQRINEIAAETNSQLLIASHSEIILSEAADASNIIALIENQTFELNKAINLQTIKYIKKSLTEIGWEKYYLAKLKGHILYLEGSTDLQMLLSFANKIGHKVEPLLRTANVTYTSDNVPTTAIKNFVAIKEFFPSLKGLAVFDNIQFTPNPKLDIICWKNRELENYFARPELLKLFAQLPANQDKTKSSNLSNQIMTEVITDYTLPAYLKDLNNDWWNTAKLSDEWLDLIFPEFYKRMNIPQDFSKRNYYQLISLIKKGAVPLEIKEKLDHIYKFLI